MKVYHTTVEQLEQAAAQVHCKLQNVQQWPTYIQFVIRPTPETDESLRSRNGKRRIAALSWYGHKVFMDALFDLNPATIVYRAQRVMHTQKEHKCTVCAKTIPLGSQAIYTFHLCGEDEHKPQYGYQCPASLSNDWYCNLYPQGSGHEQPLPF